jgi:hypothetical protein
VSEHPEHVDCADGCGVAVTHEGACRTKPGGPVVCDESNHDVDVCPNGHGCGAAHQAWQDCP